MTEVMFHFNVPDKVGYACRLLRKAYGAGSKVGVVADDKTLQALDKALWAFSALEFLPHCAASGKPGVVAASPILLATDSASFPHAQVLLHLGHEVPAGFERFERLIELVSTDETDRAHARRRWRHYGERGYTMIRHDVAAGN